ncbi:Adhesion G protein-coupled receptor F5 [Merluccius polli]|uniref:Adhesion G protein-coupled receptor F5 n=1 Tax=Merluccius polli TaxID=89951 RepID=A0AA47MUN3_MERPO|nr:Adhesion G protein-coupled receptor F5 [Merluccius polli]
MTSFQITSNTLTNICENRVRTFLRNQLCHAQAPPRIFVVITQACILYSPVCSPTSTGFQCECEETLFWPVNICRATESCDDQGNATDTCTCIPSLPADGVYCQPRFSEFVVEIEVGIPVSSATASEVVAIARQQLGIVSYPIELSTTVHITDANLTTVCYSATNSSSRQCQCEDQYGWSCDQCRTYEVCSSNTTLDPCGCINGLPPDGQLCQPITTWMYRMSSVTWKCLCCRLDQDSLAEEIRSLSMSCEQHHTYSNTYNPYSNTYNSYSNTYNSYSNIYNPYSNTYNAYSNIYNSYNTYSNTYNNRYFTLLQDKHQGYHGDHAVFTTISSILTTRCPK